MQIALSKLNKRELKRLHNIVVQGNANITHQRGNCDYFRCETCACVELCGLLLNLQTEIEKEYNSRK